MMRAHGVLGVLGALRRRLEPVVIGAGFVLLDSSPSDDGPTVEVGLLEYRLGAPPDCQLLSFYGDSSARTLIAELWSPGRLRRRLTAVTMEEVADRYRSWNYEPGSDPGVMTQEICATVAPWLSAPAARMNGAPGSISDIA